MISRVNYDVISLGRRMLQLVIIITELKQNFPCISISKFDTVHKIWFGIST